jgi:hypothetical protein
MAEFHAESEPSGEEIVLLPMAHLPYLIGIAGILFDGQLDFQTSHVRHLVPGI